MKQEDFFSQKELEQAAAATARAMLSALPPAQEERLYSPEFQKSMTALLRRERRRTASRRRTRWAAVLALVCLAGVTVWTASQAHAGGGASSWVRQNFQNSVVYSFSGAASDQALPSYRLSWLPEGYQETSRSEGVDAVYVLYNTDQGSGQCVSLRYFYVDCRNGFQLTLNREDYECKTMSVNDGEADLYLPLNEEEDTILLWLNRQEGILFCLTGSFPESIILSMAKSVTLME